MLQVTLVTVILLLLLQNQNFGVGTKDVIFGSLVILLI